MGWLPRRSSYRPRLPHAGQSRPRYHLGALLAALSIFFCELLHVTPKLYRKFFPNIYLRVAAGGVLIIALTKLLGTTDYNGAGAAVIEAAIDGEAFPTPSF